MQNVTANYEVEKIYGTLTVLPVESDPGTGNGITGSDIETFEEPVTMNGDTVFAEVSFTDGKGSSRVYLREHSYGDYTGQSWAAAEPFKIGEDSKLPLNFTGYSLAFIVKGVPKDYYRTMQINLTEKGYALVPNYMYSEIPVNDKSNDIAFYTDELSYNCNAVLYNEGFIEALQNGLIGPCVPHTMANLEKLYREHVYDTYLNIADSTKSALRNYAYSCGIYSEHNKLSLIRDIQNCILNSAEYNMNAAPYPYDVDDIVVYFLETAKEGICQHFASAATLMFRAYGIPARYTVGFTAHVEGQNATRIDGSMAHAWVEIYIDEIGWVAIEVTPPSGLPGGSGSGSSGGGSSGSGSSGSSSSSPLTPTPKPTPSSGSSGATGSSGGTPSIPTKPPRLPSKLPSLPTDLSELPEVLPDIIPEKPILLVSSYGMEKIYDGFQTEEWTGDKYYILFGSLKNGHKLNIEITEKGVGQIEPGEYTNVIEKAQIFDKDGLNVTAQYNLILYDGKTVIHKRPITIISNSASKKYDGTALTDSKWWLASGNLAMNDVLTVTIIGSQTEVGSSPNTIFNYNILNNGTGVLRYYDVTVVHGTLEVR